MNTLLVTRSGRIVDLHSIDPASISVYDVAWHLAHEIRWNGCLGRLSVLQHSVAVAELLNARGLAPSTCLFGLLHDAAEYLLGDVVSPAKEAMGSIVVPDTPLAYHALERRTQLDIWLALVGSLPSPAEEHEIGSADKDVARYEAARFGTVHWQDAIEKVAPGYIHARPDVGELSAYSRGVWGEPDEDTLRPALTPQEQVQRFALVYRGLKDQARAFG